MAHLGPTLPVAIVFAVALVEALVLPWRYWAKGVWALAVVLCGAAAAVLVNAQEQANLRAASEQAAAQATALHGLWTQAEAVSKLFPPPSNAPPAPAFGTVDEAVAALNAELAALKDQIATLKAGSQARGIDPSTAAKLSDYLRQYGNYRVVVSCAPGDVEAYNYANQLVGILKTAGWDANGPEVVTGLVEGPTMGITVFVRDPSAPDAAKVLLAAFDQFNIAHQVGISADYAIPDTATVELYVAQKP